MTCTISEADASMDFVELPINENENKLNCIGYRNPSEMNGNNLNNVRREASRFSGMKEGNI
jgi:hypothetical protein